MNIFGLIGKRIGLDIECHRFETMIFSALPSLLGTQAGQRLNRLTVYGEEWSFVIAATGKEPPLKELLLSIGRPLETTIHEPSHAPAGYFFQTRAGWLGANPAVICVFPSAAAIETIRIIAFAKEGWISQKTAVGAVNRFKKALHHRQAEFAAKTILALTRMDKLDL